MVVGGGHLGTSGHHRRTPVVAQGQLPYSSWSSCLLSCLAQGAMPRTSCLGISTHYTPDGVHNCNKTHSLVPSPGQTSQPQPKHHMPPHSKVHTNATSSPPGLSGSSPTTPNGFCSYIFPPSHCPNLFHSHSIQKKLPSVILWLCHDWIRHFEKRTLSFFHKTWLLHELKAAVYGGWVWPRTEKS